MTTDGIRLRLKTTWVEVKYEGHGDFLSKHLLDILERTSRLSPRQETMSLRDQVPEGVDHAASQGEESDSTEVAHTTSSIASRLSVKTGPELIVAAAAKLTIVDGRERFSRHDLVAEMKTAAAYYKKTYNNNLSQYLQRLEKADRLRRGNKNLYALSTAERNSLDALLSERQ